MSKDKEYQAPNLSSSERKIVISYLDMPVDERAKFLGKAYADPHISGSLLVVLAYLLTA